MSTNSTIAVKTERGPYKSIYCHWDGYFDYMYPMLSENYSTQERAEALVNLGDASFIDRRLCPSRGSGHSFDHPESGVSVFYHRDRGEDYNVSFHQTKEEVLKIQYYTYIFEDGMWKAYQGGVEVDSYEY